MTVWQVESFFFWVAEDMVVESVSLVVEAGVLVVETGLVVETYGK